MADSSSCLMDFMDDLWFNQDILFSRPPLLAPKSMSKTNGTDTMPPSSFPSKLSSRSLPSQSSISETATETKRSHAKYKAKKPLSNIVIGQPPFQLQPPAKSEVCSHPSSYLSNLDLEPMAYRRRKQSSLKSYNSLSDLENYELKGFMDLGFVFNKEKLNPEIMKMIPGLQRIVEDEKGDVERRDADEMVRRPYLSEAWLNSPLLNLQMLPKSLEGDDIKKHLRFWARKVASMAQQESSDKM